MRNKFEQRIFNQLEKSGVTFKYESEKIPYVLSGHYLPDFVLKTKSGKIYLETKGYFRPEHKRKMLAVKRQHPELDLRIVFYAPNKKYEKWAIQNGFKYSFVNIPTAWLEE